MCRIGDVLAALYFIYVSQQLPEAANQGRLSDVPNTAQENLKRDLEAYSIREVGCFTSLPGLQIA